MGRAVEGKRKQARAAGSARGRGMKESDTRTGIERSLHEYVTRPEMAFGYDVQHKGTQLLRFDTEFLKENLPGGRLLDIGCGTGRHVVGLRGKGREVVGMDLSEHMLDITTAKAERAGFDARLVQADMRAGLPFRDASFDAVTCMFSTIGLIPTFAARVEFVREVKRVLRPGGKFVFHVHNRWYNLIAPWGRLWLVRTYMWDRLFSDLEVGDRVMPNYVGIEGMYLHIFSAGEVRGLLEAAGLALEKLLYLNDDRTGEVKGWLRGVRANGFIVVARKGPEG